jgi:predicted metalloprotease
VILRFVVVLGVALAIAGCGSSGSSDEPTTESTPPPSAETSTEPTETSGETEVLERLPEVPEPTQPAPASSSLREVFDDAQAMWHQDFENAGATYQPAQLTIFRDQVDTACGAQSASVGPFYCPADHGVYLDTRFFDALGRAAGVELGDFAQAYVVAHEVGHHVQNLLGVMQRVHAASEQDPAGENARSVLLELQADCFAGVWAHSRYQRGQLTPADLEDALRAAAVVGSDFQQKLAGAAVRPEDWTHGSSAQRQHWLTVGVQRGDPSACDTFSGAS